DSSGSHYDFPLPVATSDTTGFTSVAAGGLHTCASGVSVTYCWGSDRYAQIGNRTISATDDSLPTAMDSTLGLRSLTGDTASTVALGLGNKVYWWGTRGASLSAPVSADRSALPKAVPNYTFISIATGRGVSCGLLSNNFVFCWGSSADPNFPATDKPAGVPAP
ncbi:MAG TPA: hypothetical protein VFU45_08105, partial [Gemmatimonadales bacterium]|nr:hypothetical protein [Gemmatimonadales bacterium]